LPNWVSVNSESDVMGNQLSNPLSNPLLISAGITTSLAFLVSGYGLYELLAIDSSEPQPDRATDRQSTPEPSAIAPNTAAPEPLTLGSETGNRAQLATWSGRSSAAVPASRLALMLIASSDWQTPIAPVVQHLGSQVDELAAKGFLQAAFTQAEQGDFVAAIRFLKQIPVDAPSYDRAQIKIAEYKQKEAIQAEAQLRRADALANIKDYSRARVYLKQVPEESSTYEVAKAKMTEFATQEDIQAYAWFREANVLAAQGKLVRAIECLKRIPLGTSAYTQAQEKIAQYSPKLSESAKIAQQPTRPANEVVRLTPPSTATETPAVGAAQPSVRPSLPSSELSPIQPAQPTPQRLVRRSEPPAYTRQTPPAPPAPTAEFAPTAQTTVQPNVQPAPNPTIAPVQPPAPSVEAQTVGNIAPTNEVVPAAQPQVVEANRSPQTPVPAASSALVRAIPSTPSPSVQTPNARNLTPQHPNTSHSVAPSRLSAAALNPSRQLREVHPQDVMASPVGDRW
jgi:tetratricopeptide (TPR) repeat protein